MKTIYAIRKDIHDDTVVIAFERQSDAEACAKAMDYDEWDRLVQEVPLIGMQTIQYVPYPVPAYPVAYPKITYGNYSGVVS